MAFLAFQAVASEGTIVPGTAAELLVIDAAAFVETPTLAQATLLAASKNIVSGDIFVYSSAYPIEIEYDVRLGGILKRRTEMRTHYTGAGAANLPDELTFSIGSQFWYTDTVSSDLERYEVDTDHHLIKHNEG